MIKKLKLTGSGNKEGRSFFIMEKKKEFFPLFSNFLINCGIQDPNFVDEYSENAPNINNFIDRVYHFQNEKYDLDLILTEGKIILIVRTNKSNLVTLRKGIEKICEI
jgi:hypothetical protein